MGSEMCIRDSTGTNDVIMTITVVSTATGYAGAYTVSEEVRLVTS